MLLLRSCHLRSSWPSMAPAKHLLAHSQLTPASKHTFNVIASSVLQPVHLMQNSRPFDRPHIVACPITVLAARLTLTRK